MSRYRCHTCQRVVSSAFEDGDVIKRADYPARAWRCPDCRPGPPACADECRQALRTEAGQFLRGVEVHITWAPPLIPSGFEPLGLRCPHGVLWFMEPTSEGRALLGALPLEEP